MLRRVQMTPQPDDQTCGPTCLHAVYRYYDDHITFDELRAGVPMLKAGGTLGVHLGNHALERGYRVTLFTYNLRIFDPTWFRPDAPPLAGLLAARQKAASRVRVRATIPAYLRFLELGGEVRHEVLTPRLIEEPLNRAIPVLLGVSSTYLYQEARETRNGAVDSIGGEPAGHFVVLSGRDPWTSEVEVSDPWERNPMSGAVRYRVSMDRVLGALLLGVLTYDANFLVIEPKSRPPDPGPTP